MCVLLLFQNIIYRILWSQMCVLLSINVKYDRGICTCLRSTKTYFDRCVCRQVCVFVFCTSLFWSRYVFTNMRRCALYKHILIEVFVHKSASLSFMQTYSDRGMFSQVFIFYANIFFIEVSVHKCLRFIPTTTKNHGSMYLQVFTFYINIFFVEICVHKCTSLAFHEEMWLGKTRGQKYNSVFKCIEFYILICVSNLK